MAPTALGNPESTRPAGIGLTLTGSGEGCQNLGSAPNPSFDTLQGFAFGRLWLLAVFGVLLITGPTILVWTVLIVVWFLDFAKAVWNKVRGRPYERPPLLPSREPRRRF
jgi:hypothetical protein